VTPAPEAPARVLVVDDTELNRDLLTRRVQRLGHEVRTAENGRVALERLREEAFDVVLLDVMMPEVGGEEVLRTMKGDPALLHVPVIMISALEDAEVVARCISLGADDYLPKPFDPSILRARLGASLAKKRLHDREQVYARSLERELEIGREIQRSFLPATLPTLPGWEVAADLQPARQVSGDFYDVFPMAGGRELALVVGDVCDKGVGAALFMALIRTMIRALAEQSDGARWTDQSRDGERRREVTDRAEARRGHLRRTLTLTSEYLAGTHGDTNVFATIFIGILDGETGVLDYINAGHEPPLVAGAGRTARLAPSGPAIGLMPGMAFGVEQVELAPGEHLLAWTDGVTEARNTAGELLGEEPVLAAAGAAAPTAAAALDRVRGLVERHAAGAEPADDVTLLAVRRAG
jgi:serine phosphatase RsbU (regulator of sigma subunit)